MITDLEKYQNNITGLPSLDDTRYENIFKVAKSDKFFFFNIIKKISIPDDIQSEVYIEVRVNSKQPWTTLSNRIYGNQNLWWLICLTNKIYNPINNPEVGQVYKVIKPEYISTILQEIKRLTT